MKIVFIVVGKTIAPYLLEAEKEYINRLKHYIPFEYEVIPELKNTKKLTADQQKDQEGKLIQKLLKPGDHIVLLDEKGKEFTSKGFADYLNKKMQVVNKRLVFIVGGPYGFSPEIYELAQEKISLSKMTFSHQMVRTFFMEQIYRAMTIINNEPYHHE